MYAIEHALLNLLKNKGRNILLGVIIFAIITSAVTALAIFNTSDYIMKETMSALQCAVRVAPRMQSIGGGLRTATGQNSQIVTIDSQNASADNPEHAINIELYLSFAESKYLDGSDIKEDNRSADGVDAVYYLKQPDMLTAFEAEARNKGLPDDYFVRTDESAFEQVIGPVENLNKLSLTFLIIILTLGAIIMVLLSAIAIRERKYEIGVLRAMGMKKKSVALSLWVEIIAVFAICFIIGIVTGTALSQPVSDSMMTWRTQPSAAQSSSLADRINETDAAPLEKIDITMRSSTILEILGITVLLASISGFISISRITKSEPIKILMERN